MRNLLWRRRLLGTYVGGGENAGIISYDGHFCAVIALMVKKTLLQLYEYIWILFKSGIQIPNMVLWLRSGTMDPRNDLSPFLLKIVGLS